METLGKDTFREEEARRAWCSAPVLYTVLGALLVLLSLLDFDYYQLAIGVFLLAAGVANLPAVIRSRWARPLRRLSLVVVAAVVVLSLLRLVGMLAR